MEFRFNKQEEAFEAEVEHFLSTELPLDWPERSMHWPGGYGTMEYKDEEQIAIGRGFKSKLAEKVRENG
jgi:hypothetical protein